MKKLIKKIAASAGIGLVRSERLQELLYREANTGELFDSMLRAVNSEGHSKAEAKQDVFVLLMTKFKRNGFFVEFGATNGVDSSNTYLLERTYGWSGILAEPATIWHENLAANRKAIIDHSCIWSESGKTLRFNMTNDAALSTIEKFSSRDLHAQRRKSGVTYDVESISLNDLLEKYHAPRDIDYLSIDTEGSEFEILSNFDFRKRNIHVITCEHNYTEDRERIYSLLTRNGYRRTLEGFSGFDDWYCKDQ